MFKKKYPFDEIEIDQTIHLRGKLSAIRSAASMWGTRYGVWLTVAKVEGGAEVTRRATPTKQRSVRVSLDQRLQRIEDGVRFLSVLTIRLMKKLEEQ